MFSRLKSLPLTIVLTILIWMYAEAEFSTTREGVAVRIQFLSSDPNNFNIRAVDEAGTHRSLDVTLTLQGAKDRIEHIVGQSKTSDGGDVLITLVVTRDPKLVTDDPKGTTVLLTSVLNELPFFRDKEVAVVAATPDRVRLQRVPIDKSPPASRP